MIPKLPEDELYPNTLHYRIYQRAFFDTEGAQPTIEQLIEIKFLFIGNSPEG